ncbi:MAG: hypothetical protein Q9M20_03750 [Mariprofundaceae bacterium]|nr:hypothetical protein [Mariprofundaceae bacterium]
MKNILVLMILGVTSGLTWQAWNPPEIQTQLRQNRLLIPDIQAPEETLWRVVTRRMVWKQAVADMKNRLLKEGFEPEQIQRREPVELHAFDDPRTFKTQAEARKVKAMWEEKGIEADVLKHQTDNNKSVFKVGLGRFYISEYAERTQDQIKKTKQAYSYERRTIRIPSYHFVFPAMHQDKAESLWKRLQNIGVTDPVIVQQREFDKLYTSKSANRSNK